MHQRHARIPVARYAALYRLINDSLDDEGFALFSRPLRRGSFELLCRAVLSAPTLEAALDRIARSLRVLLDDFSVELETGGRAAVLVIAEEQPLPVGRARAGVRLRVAAAPDPRPGRLAGGAPAAAGRGQLPLPAAAACGRLRTGVRPAPHLRRAAPGGTLSGRVAGLAGAPRRGGADAFLADAPASITTLYRRDRALALRVREHLRAALPEHLALPALAKRLFLSPRTLHRRLEDEGTSFRAIKDGLRRELAIEWLTKTSRPLGRIGADLGFADAAAFYRAFSAWTGSGPREYRRRFAAGIFRARR
jgi:AraC-like DNA-binding protein